MKNNTIMTTIQRQLKQMDDILERNLKEACVEVEDWRNNGTLQGLGVIRSAASCLTDPVFSGQELVHAERHVNRLACEFVIRTSK